MKTVKDAVRELKGVWPDDRRDGLYEYWGYGALVAYYIDKQDQLIGVRLVCDRNEFEREAALQGYRGEIPEGATHISNDGVFYSYNPRFKYRDADGSKLIFRAYWDDNEWSKDYQGEDWCRENLIPLYPEQEAGEWNGEGLPPIGEQVEVTNGIDGWQEATVIGYDDGFPVCKLPKDPFHDCPYDAYNSDAIRPIQSERDKALQAIEEILSVNIDTCMIDIAEALYDAGYRKVEASHCQHEWVDARNEVISYGGMCIKCHATREGKTSDA